MVAELIWLILAEPKDEDVVAGPIGLVIFVSLCVVVGLLGWSLNKQLKKARQAEEAGVYGSSSADDDTDSDAATSDSGDTAGD